MQCCLLMEHFYVSYLGQICWWFIIIFIHLFHCLAVDNRSNAESLPRGDARLFFTGSKGGGGTFRFIFSWIVERFNTALTPHPVWKQINCNNHRSVFFRLEPCCLLVPSYSQTLECGGHQSQLVIYRDPYFLLNTEVFSYWSVAVSPSPRNHVWPR